MAERASRLGRGLASLIGDMAVAGPDGPEGAEAADGGVRRLPVGFIAASRNNPRRHFDDEQLADLANSIREKGVMQPLLVRPTGRPDRYEIIAGERRWRAAQRAGLHEVPVIVREVEDKEALELAIIENVQRADLNPLEEAMGYGQLIAQFGYTQNDLAQVIGKSRPHVANTLRLLKLPETVQEMVGRGELTAGHARTLVTAPEPEALARRIVDEGLSVREAEALSQERAKPGGKPRVRREEEPQDADTKALERQIADALGLKVALSFGPGGGRLEIKYSTLDQLDTLCMKLMAPRR